MNSFCKIYLFAIFLQLEKPHFVLLHNYWHWKTCLFRLFVKYISFQTIWFVEVTFYKV